MAKHLLPKLNYEQAAQAVSACIRSKRAGMLIGSPGVGKTALTRDASEAVGLPCRDLIASNMDPTDVAGLPYRDGSGGVGRELFPEIKAVCDSPGVLFLDEATTMPKSVEGPMLRLALERNAGGTPLHSESAVLLACNPPEQAPSGIEHSAAFINRIIILMYEPTFEEIRNFFNGEPVRAKPAVVSPQEFETRARLEMLDFAATLSHDTSLLMMDPPRGSIDQGEPWASPRAWEIGLCAYAAHGAAYAAGKEDDVGYALLAGVVGPQPAAQYLAIRKLRQFLPSIEQILQHPLSVVVPAPVDHQIAALGVLARVADVDVWAAWTYAERMQPEIGAAIARILMNKPPQVSAHAETGRAAQVNLLAKIKKATR